MSPLVTWAEQLTYQAPKVGGAPAANSPLHARISNDGEFVHAAPWSNAQQGHTNVSHGCVDLSQPTPSGSMTTSVSVTSSPSPTPAAHHDTYGDWALSWAQWQTGTH